MIILDNHQKGSDNGLYLRVIHYQTPFDDYLGLLFHPRSPDDINCTSSYNDDMYITRTCMSIHTQI
jgi:hypothetical protein